MNLESTVRHFACVQCGRCCNRTPEVELSEAAALADVFVFRLMFRVYWLPKHLRDYRGAHHPNTNASAIFYEKKRLLSAFAARKYPVKLSQDSKSVQYTKYLMISALAVDTRQDACSALMAGRCTIYDRRPLSCRSIPLHYSRPAAMAEMDLKTFVETPGYECDTGKSAPIILDNGRIRAPEVEAARSKAIAVAERDRRWTEAIVKRMNGDSSGDGSLPSLQEIESSAHVGVMTTSMRTAWQIASEIAFITRDECDSLVSLQLRTIDLELDNCRCSPAARETLAGMQAEYRHHLSDDQAHGMIGSRQLTS